jgi:glycosyltransferase involved in cell wall biosynthesis
VTYLEKYLIKMFKIHETSTSLYLSSFAETLGMVTIESILQKARCQYCIGWAPELIIHGESGFLVHPQNHSHYANMIITLLKDTNLCLTMGKMQDNGSRMFLT